MKIQFTPKDFLRLFKIAASAATARDIKPILQNVKIVADKEVGTILMATDTEIGIRVRLDVDVLENGIALLPIKTLRTILDSTKEKILTMESVMTDASASEPIDDSDDDSEWESADEDDDDSYEPVRYTPQRRRTCSVVLFGEHERHELCTSNPDEFPNIEGFAAEAYHELEADDMKTLIQRTVFAIDKDNPRYALGGVCFEDDHQNVVAVATDGRRLAVQTTDRCTIHGKPTIGKSFKKPLDDGTEQERIDYPIIGVSALNLLMKVLDDKSFKKQKKHIYSSTVKMEFAEHRVLFHCESANGNEQMTIFSRLLEGKFPKWRGIVPDKEKPMACAKVNSDALLAAVKNVQGITTDLEPGIYITFENGQMTLEGRGREKGNAKTSIAAGCKGKATCKIDHSFLTGMLKTLDDTTITIHCNGDNPLLIEADGEGFIYVAMPRSGEKDAPSPNQAWDENGVDLGMIAAETADKQYEELKANVVKDVEEKMRQAQEMESVNEVPLDSDGDVTTDYFYSEIPDTFVNSVCGTTGHFDRYAVGCPHFCPDEHLFRTEIDHDGTTWFLEWDCIPGKRIVPDWECPDRITSLPILIDENGYMAWEYLESFDDGVLLSVIDPATGIQGEYEMELPRFLPEESLFRTTGKSSDGQSVVVEWACLPGKRRLVATTTEGIGTIDDWASPSRVIPLDEFTNGIIGRGGLLAEEENEVCPWCEESRCACDYEDEPSEWATGEVNESETESESETEESDAVELRFEELTENVDSIVEAFNDEAAAFFVPKQRYQRFLSDMMTVIIAYEDVFKWLTQQIEAEAESGSESENPGDTPAPPPVQSFVADTVSRPVHKPMALPKLKQTALQWT